MLAVYNRGTPPRSSIVGGYKSDLAKASIPLSPRAAQLVYTDKQGQAIITTHCASIAALGPLAPVVSTDVQEVMLRQEFVSILSRMLPNGHPQSAGTSARNLEYILLQLTKVQESRELRAWERS